MSGSLGEAVLDLAADGSGLITDINKARPAALSALNELGRVGGLLLAAGITIAAAAVVGITALVWNSANALDEAYDKIQTKTGATGQQLEILKADFNEVFKSVPEDANTVADAISSLNQRLGLTGPILQETSKALLEMTRITGGDLQTNADAFTRLVGDWSVPLENSSVALDKMFKASQLSGTGVDRLMQLMVQFGAPMREFGFSFEQSAAMLGKWEKEGVNTELVMGSLRIAAGHFANENVPLQEGLKDTFDAIKNAKSESEGLALAMDVFGARAGPDMAAAIRENRFELGDMVPMLEDAQGAIMDTADATKDWGERLQIFKNRVTTAFAPAGAKLMDVASKLLDKIAEVFERSDVQKSIEQISDYVGILADDIGAYIPIIIDNFFKLVEWLKNNKPIIVGILDALGVAIATFGYTTAAAVAAVLVELLPVIAIMALVGLAAYLLYRAWTENWGGVQTKMQAVWAFLQPILQQLWNWLSVNIPIAIQSLSGFWTSTLLPAVQSFWAFLQPILQQLWNWLSVNIPAAIKALSSFWTSTLLPAIQAVWGWMSGVWFPFLMAMANFIGSVLGAVIRVWAAVWQNVLKPALSAVYGTLSAQLMPIFTRLSSFFNSTLLPIIKTVAKWISGELVGAFNALTGIIKTVTATLKTMTDVLNNIELPAALTPGSPTPFEIGLWGIHKALKSLATMSLPTISAQMQVASAGFANPSYAYSPATAGSSAMSGDSNFYAPVTFEVKDQQSFEKVMRTTRKS